MKDVLNQIQQTYKLPQAYLNFLKETPDEQYYEGEGIVNELRVYGYNDLIQNQEGYYFNPMTNEIIEDWPKNYIVIADDGADPYVLDLSKSDGNEAPVLYAMHGEGDWDFENHSKSFTEFLKFIKSQEQI